MTTPEQTTVNALDVMEENREKLSFDEMKTIILCNYPNMNLEHYDYDKLEKLLILVAWQNDEININTKQYSIMRLNDVLFYMKRYHIGILCYVCPFFLTTFIFFAIKSTGFFTFIHEVFGHLYLGGSLLTHPRNRYTISYPSPYYQVDKFDSFIHMDKNPLNVIKFLVGDNLILNNSDFRDKNAGYAFPYLRRNNFTDIYDLWGPYQSDGFLYLSGMVPNYLLAVMIGILGIYKMLTVKSRRGGIIFLISMHIYTFQIGKFLNLFNDESASYNADIKQWSRKIHKYTGLYTEKSYEHQTILVLVFLYPFIMITLLTYFLIHLKKFIHKRRIYQIIKRNVEYEQFMYEKMCMISQKKWFSWLKRYINQPETDIVFNDIDDTIYNSITNHDVLSIYERPYVLGFEDNWLLAYNACKLAIFLSILFVPIINAFLYTSPYQPDAVKFLPLLLTIILILELAYNYFSGEISKKYKVLTFLELANLFNALYHSYQYMNNYKFSELVYLWGDTYLVTIYLSYSISNYFKYKRYSQYFDSLIISDVREDT